uniref:RNA methyltransferase n=1 Tax=Clostridium botulinum TaxID=1491 RepID=A0A0A0UVB2_CLOBO|nr:RNA methyltransferase [Clostridium botulinum]
MSCKPSIFPLCLSKPLQKTFYGQCKISHKKFFGVFLCTLINKEHKNFDKQLQ